MVSTNRPVRARGLVRAGIASIAAVAAAAAVFVLPASAQREYFVLPHATLDPATTSTREVVVLAGGCFWGVQAVYQRIRGVESSVSGYSGGAAETAQYRLIGTGATGHAEAVEIVYNPQEISYGEILRIFFSVAHNPTQLNYQGSDVGTQYRSNVFYTTEAQRQVTEAYIAQLTAAGVYNAPIVTRVDALAAFYPAEAYHQDYLVNEGRGDPYGPNVAYLDYWDVPKVQNTQSLFPEYWRDSPVTVASTRPDLI